MDNISAEPKINLKFFFKLKKFPLNVERQALGEPAFQKRYLVGGDYCQLKITNPS